MRIGQWPKRKTSVSTTHPIALENQGAIRRTGTDLHNDEINIGNVHSRTPLDDNRQFGDDASGTSQSDDAALADMSVVTRDKPSTTPHDYYQFEWFWILIGMVLVMVSALIIDGLIFYQNIVSPIVAIRVALGLLSLLIYTSTFVILTEYHEPMERFLDKYARIGPGLQQGCLRFCTFLYALGLIGVTIYRSIFFPL